MLTRGLTNVRHRYFRVVPSLLGAIATFIALAVFVIYPVWGVDPQPPVSDAVIRTIDVGKAFVSGNGFVIPFELASLLLTAAMVGAIVIARDTDQEA